MNPLHKRIFEISHKYKLSHVGSCIGCVDLIDSIYKNKSENNLFILSNGHAGIALYTILEKHYGFNAEKLFLKHGVHPNRDLNDKIYCSTGSLGMGITVACGLALANKTRNIHCLISDGESFEGSVTEALRFKNRNKLDNLIVYLNFNGYSAYNKIHEGLITELWSICLNIIIHNSYEIIGQYSFLEDLDAHYHIITDKEWDLIKDA